MDNQRIRNVFEKEIKRHKLEIERHTSKSKIQKHPGTCIKEEQQPHEERHCAF